jgi:hypothetical protein
MLTTALGTVYPLITALVLTSLPLCGSAICRVSFAGTYVVVGPGEAVNAGVGSGVEGDGVKACVAVDTGVGDAPSPSQPEVVRTNAISSRVSVVNIHNLFITPLL